MDPRVKTPLPALTQQFTLSKQLYDDVVAASTALTELRNVREQLAKVKERAGQGSVAGAIASLDKDAAALEGRGGGGRFGGGGGEAQGPAPETLNSVRGSLSSLMGMLQQADVAPTTQVVSAVTERRKVLAPLLSRWAVMKGPDLQKLNTQLKQANLPEVTVATSPAASTP